MNQRRTSKRTQAVGLLSRFPALSEKWIFSKKGCAKLQQDVPTTKNGFRMLLPEEQAKHLTTDQRVMKQLDESLSKASFRQKKGSVVRKSKRNLENSSSDLFGACRLLLWRWDTRLAKNCALDEKKSSYL